MTVLAERVSRDESPLAATAVELRHALLDRYDGTEPGLPRPDVVALGAADVLARPEPARGSANVHLTASAVLIGPWGANGGPPRACGHCLGARWQRLRSRSERDALETGDATCGGVGWPLLSEYLTDAVWHLYRAVMTGGRADSALAQVSCLEFATLRTRTYPLLADPLCPTCPRPAGPPVEPGLRRRLKPAPDVYRLTSVDDYALPTTALVNPVCGALCAGTVLNLTSPTTAPVTGSVFVRSYAGLVDVTWSGQANSVAASRGLATLEGLERYAGTHRRRAPEPILDSYRALGDTALDPADCGLYAPETYRDDPTTTVFSADRRIPWVRGYSLRDDRPILVPRRLCHYSAGAVGDNFVFTTSSGCAVGSCLEEAILFGLLELIERDAFLLGWYGGARLAEIDLASSASPTLRAMVDRAELRGYDVRAFDNRVDLAVPVVTGLAVRRDGGPGTLSFAAAASLDPETAVESALAEVLTYIPQMPRQVAQRWAELEAMAEDYGNVRQLVDHSGLFGLPRMRKQAQRYLDRREPMPMHELYPAGSGTGFDLLADLRHCQAELTRAGFDVIVVDQTTPEQEWMGLHSVCMIVPGLLPIDFGWSRQRALRMPRLRTAFRRAGWRAGDLTEEEIHRVPHPFP
ncbi:TOMM precursor leader peptide-binding protein [Cryptosporangium minutisporangium]|uniref:YcaO domain-containing protein n=1 Tax=Cryptosporangium minutisporangium TaxID=113569 RepID=A0ABP6SR35_9ACTN